jgi:hypothetical protein
MTSTFVLYVLSQASIITSIVLWLLWPGRPVWWIGLALCLGAWIMTMILTLQNLWFGFAVLVISVTLVVWLVVLKVPTSSEGRHRASAYDERSACG